MSLVAYGSSDESESSDVEESTGASNATENNLGAKIAKTDDLDISDSDSEIVDSRPDVPEDTDSNIDGLLKRLPSPKAAVGVVIDETDELEEEVKPKASQVADIPKPPPPKKLRQPVKITIPALPDSDDGGEPMKKKPKTAPKQGKVGLFSVLPAPVHASKKESNRILLPYSLGKKPKPPSSSVTKPALQTSDSKFSNLRTSLADYDSDSDENESSNEPVNFFSIDSSTEKRVEEKKEVSSVSQSDIPTVPLPPTMSRTSLSLPPPAKSKDLDVAESQGGESSGSVNNESASNQPMLQDAPLTFKGGVTSQRYSFSNPYASSSSVAAVDGGDQNVYYNMPYDGTSQYPEVGDDQSFQYDQEFLRMQGKKHRGKEEINIVDVKADDFTAPEELAKNMTEETTYQSHSKKDGNQPTSQQRRKHQIHYLAFQAKEMELELKNQWSNNRMTKKQTQAKYGF